MIASRDKNRAETMRMNKKRKAKMKMMMKKAIEINRRRSMEKKEMGMIAKEMMMRRRRKRRMKTWKEIMERIVKMKVIYQYLVTRFRLIKTSNFRSNNPEKKT